jgi:hypothetical protein
VCPCAPVCPVCVPAPPRPPVSFYRNHFAHTSQAFQVISFLGFDAQATAFARAPSVLGHVERPAYAQPWRPTLRLYCDSATHPKEAKVKPTRHSPRPSSHDTKDRAGASRPRGSWIGSIREECLTILFPWTVGLFSGVRTLASTCTWASLLSAMLFLIGKHYMYLKRKGAGCAVCSVSWANKRRPDGLRYWAPSRAA